MSAERQKIRQHEGAKYLRRIHAADGSGLCAEVDVYEVLLAFQVTCPATSHAIKKLLAAGDRGKGDRLADLKGAMAALNRAIDVEERKTALRDARPAAPVGPQCERQV